MSTADQDRASLGELVSRATGDLSTLFRAEFALAKAEVKQSAVRGLAGVTALVVGGVLALFSLPVFSFAVAYWLHAWWKVPLAIAFLITGGLMLLFAVVCAWLAKRLIQKMQAPERTIASAKESAAVLSNIKPHPRAASDGEPVDGRSATARVEQ
ncbi:phage holin family protein [Streptomyces alkaliterrae]|uniref:Phage holin family protein n=1 Tax=Streptomyces alkaliterrae TaxID=2213162 RepID=A0A5P0YIY6_9ACTN|nr:phage holin family protein [Streptomyces alkaliterrae]MBB1251874.1 phage holin family protein [Streptomyces alkaliterrae]MBB1261370.1 phage holin family protein [Streptomyces alkaliterrae]MQS00286.1 phage holin family protein [Streptomyces alkaliterrae]